MKKHMKPVMISIVLLLLIAFLAAGCSQPPKDTPATSTGSTAGQPQENTTEAVNKDGPLSQYVLADIVETVTGSDNLGNDWSIPICVPKLLPFSDDAITCQKEIEAYFTPRVEEIRSNSSLGYSPNTASIDYKAYQNGNILSVVICHASTYDLNTYLVYNFHMESGKRLDTETLMDKLQVTDYTKKITQIIISHYEAMNTVMSSSIDPDFYNQQLATTTSKENLDKAMPYIDEDGSIKVIINIYGFAGATYYPQIFSLT